MFEFGTSQKKRRHKRALNYDMTVAAKSARWEARAKELAEKKAKRASKKKHVKAMGSTARKSAKFRELKREAIKACQSLKKSVKAAEAKLRERAKEIGPIVNRFNIAAEDGLFFTSNVNESSRGNPNFDADIDFENIIDGIQMVIDDLED